MASFLSWLFSPQDYMPHGMCFLWQPELIWLHVTSDSAIALAYYSIPIALGYFAWKRTNGHACARFLAISPPDLDEVKDAVDEIVRDGGRASEVLKRIRAMLKNSAPERGRSTSTLRSRGSLR
jgi:hypothetical protein